MNRTIFEKVDQKTGELYLTLVDSDETTWDLKSGMVCEITGCSPAANRYGRKCKILRFEKQTPVDIFVWIQYLDTKGRAKYSNVFEFVPINRAEMLEND